jgi:hypothetical protein
MGMRGVGDNGGAQGKKIEALFVCHGLGFLLLR